MDRGLRIPACLALAMTLTACSAENDGKAAIPYDPGVEQYSGTARLLTALISESVHLDFELVARVEDALGQIAELTGQPAKIVHDGFLNEINVSITDAKIARRWERGRIRSGDRYLDRLADDYGLIRIERINIRTPSFNLTFDRSLNLDELIALYKQSPHIGWATRNSAWVGGCGGEHNGGMWILSKGDDLHLVFARGWGDCPSGCIHCEYTYYTHSGGSVTVVDQLPDGEVRRFSRWNIPAVLPATSFDGLDDLLAHFEHEDWWVRRHALEAAGDLLTSLTPRYAADHRNWGAWGQMQALAHQRRAAIVERVTAATHDADGDVASAARSLHRLLVPQELAVGE